MRKHKTKIMVVAAIAVVLIAAWLLGSPHVIGSEDIPAFPDGVPALLETDSDDDALADAALLSSADNIDRLVPDIAEEEQEAPTAGEEDESVTLGSDLDSSAQELESAPSTPTPAPTPTSTPIPTTPPTQTEPPATSFYVTLSVRVDTILHNMHLLDQDKHELIPASGVIFHPTRVRVEQGESVFEVLQREMRRVGIHMSSRATPAFNSAYVEAIQNIFEFDAGPLSGWMYRVNGIFPNFGSSQYILNPDDVIEWVYTVDLGRDVGGTGVFG